MSNELSTYEDIQQYVKNLFVEIPELLSFSFAFFSQQIDTDAAQKQIKKFYDAGWKTEQIVGSFLTDVLFPKTLWGSSSLSYLPEDFDILFEKGLVSAEQLEKLKRELLLAQDRT